MVYSEKTFEKKLYLTINIFLMGNKEINKKIVFIALSTFSFVKEGEGGVAGKIILKKKYTIF